MSDGTDALCVSLGGSRGGEGREERQGRGGWGLGCHLERAEGKQLEKTQLT